MAILTVTYLDPSTVTETKETQAPRSNSRTGYGPKIPTPHMLKIAGVWRRVYVMIWSNSGSPYVLIKGKPHLLGSYDPRDAQVSP